MKTHLCFWLTLIFESEYSELMNGVQEAAGSIPVTRTFTKHLLMQVLFFFQKFRKNNIPSDYLLKDNRRYFF